MTTPNDDPLRLLVLVAHPDDAEIRAGGLAAQYRNLGHTVKFVSMTNGDAGHHRLAGPELAAIRRREAEAAAAVIGAEVDVWAHHDGQLQPTLELRWQVIREIRQFAPDLVLTHRPDDYHPDHRAVGNVVRDASYLVTVPAILPEVVALRRDPVVAYLFDRFTRPAPFQPDVVIDVGEQAETVVRMLACHGSQVFEWLPYNRRVDEHVPDGEAERLAWLGEQYLDRAGVPAEQFRRQLIDVYGEQHGNRVRWAEAFEVSEYATPLEERARRRLFPLLP